MACGGGSGSDEDQITDLITTAVGSTDASLCTEAFTLKFVETFSDGKMGDEAISECETQLPKDTTENTDVEVTNVEVDGDAATADATFTNSEDGRVSASFSLADEDGDWKIDDTRAKAKP